MRKRLQSIPVRLAAMGSFLAFYILAVRPLRDLFSSSVAGSLIFGSTESLEHVVSAVIQTRSVIVTYLSNSSEMVLSYIPQFGFFFLLAMLGLIFFNPKPRVYGWLAGFHAGAEALVLLFMTIGVKITIAGFVLADFIMLYLSPLVSLGFVVYASLAARREREEKKD